jgi:hypothetical protein
MARAYHDEAALLPEDAEGGRGVPLPPAPAPTSNSTGTPGTVAATLRTADRRAAAVGS